MKLKKVFITQDVDDTQVMVSTDNKLFSGIIRSNKTGAFIVNCLKENTTIDEIVKKMQEIYDGPEEVMRKDAEMIVFKLDSIGALEK